MQEETNSEYNRCSLSGGRKAAATAAVLVYEVSKEGSK